MAAYLFRRLLLVTPTLFGIIAINFAVIQFAPGGPGDQRIAELRGRGDIFSRMTGTTSDVGGPGTYRGARGLGPHLIADLNKMFGFDKPPLTRFVDMVGGYLRFDFGRGFFRDQLVLLLVGQRLPVSVSLGLWSTLLIYLISIPLDLAKAVRDGSRFDLASSAGFCREFRTTTELPCAHHEVSSPGNRTAAPGTGVPRPSTDLAKSCA